MESRFQNVAWLFGLSLLALVLLAACSQDSQPAVASNTAPDTVTGQDAASDPGMTPSAPDNDTINASTQSSTPNAANPVASSAQASDAVSSVEIVGFAFKPAELKIKVGTTVTWTNKDSAPHTVTSVTGTELDSPNLGTGRSYYHTFNDKGTFDYYCTIHPMMKGKVIVE